MHDFTADIDIRQNTYKWGPYVAMFTGGIPSGTTINGVKIRAYVGNLTPDENLTNKMDYANLIIDTDTISYDTDMVWWYTKYNHTLAGKTLTLVFDITDSNGGKYTFYLYRVIVRNTK